ncbi:hypothetical protein ADIARSV_0511 [Arcticibacter svalbardensis MN12-7]|uniref:Uncharacterized protein n=2 Tax=Arcticibacter TaxID=1288026 RepID=R9GWZ3_9SPHI|nr:hypothetical protein ADIARSV_0511 [Arcticibacter svalbardensis MN12-7]
MLGVSTAMAMKMEHKRAIQSYRFISEEPNRYVVQQAALAADSYDCNTNPSSICTIESSTAPVLMGGQYKLEKTSSSLTPGVFE